MRLSTYSVLLVLCLNLAAQPKKDDEPQKSKVQWQPGPVTGHLGKADVKVPAGMIFADAQNTRLFMEETHNLVSNVEVGTIASAKDNWFVVFEFDETGYVKDDDKDELDAAALLKSIQDNTKAANEERKKRGYETMTILGWMQAPRYDAQTHNLEWATRAKTSSGGENMNYNTRILGRRGVMRLTLVAGPEQMQAVLPDYRGVISGFTYTPDNHYSAFRSGDKIAEYGLSALVLGGAAAIAVKSGLLKTLGKLIVPILLAGAAAIKALFSRFTRRKETLPGTDEQTTT